MKFLVCADASVSAKLVLYEADSAMAQALWDVWTIQQAQVVAPPLWMYEVISTVRKHVYRALLPAAEEVEAIATLRGLPVQLLAPDELHQRAWEFAHHFNRPTVYDAHYLALADLLGCEFWTADERLFNTVRHELPWVRWLGHYEPLTSS